jgi:YD repeat-containing protein
VTDPQGQTVEYIYDSNFRLVAVTDALNQVTTFAYEHATDPNLLTKITDPFGRFAILAYDALGRLNSITDVAGMTSTFTYDTSDFIVSMTTPYGTTTFQHEPDQAWSAQYRMIEVTDPLGGKERMEFHLHNTQFPAMVSSSEVPTGFSASNAQMDYWNTFWDSGHGFHPLITPTPSTELDAGADAIRACDGAATRCSIKKPLESRCGIAKNSVDESHTLTARNAAGHDRPCA